MHQEIGVPVLLIDAEDVKRLAPYFATEDVELAAFESESGYAMPSDTANALLNAARTKGARLLQDCAVIGVTAAGGRVVRSADIPGRIQRTDRGERSRRLGREAQRDGRPGFAV